MTTRVGGHIWRDLGLTFEEEWIVLADYNLISLPLIDRIDPRPTIIGLFFLLELL